MKCKESFLFGFNLLLFVFLNILISSIGFILGFSINSFNFIISSILTIIVYMFIMFKNDYSLKKQSIFLIALVTLIFGCIFLSGILYDNSYDGNSYHKTAIGELSYGWNPVYESIDEFNDSNNEKVNNTFSIWNDHYGKGYWIYAANVYKITGNIECGKSLTFIVCLSTFFIGLSFLSFKNKSLNYILAFLVAFNPVILCQLGTFYNDGVLGNLLIIMIVSLSIMALKQFKDIKKLNFVLYFITLCILVNIKFTGFAYTGLYSLFYYMYFAYDKKLRKENLKKLTFTAIVALVFSIGIIGVSTYPKNLIEHSHPFYPLYGKDSVDIMEANTPTGFLEMNRFKRFLVSNFSKSVNESNNGNISYEIKTPFTFNTDELNEFTSADVRVAGYGVLFGGIIIISFISIGYYLFKNKTEHKNYLCLLLLPIVITGLIVVILKESWWARYLPQLYLLPIIAILMLSFYKTEVSKFLKNTLVVLLIINSYLIMNTVILSNIYKKNVIDQEFEIYKEIDKPINISSNEFSGSLFNVIDNLDEVTVVSDACTLDGRFLMTGKVCVDIIDGSDEE